MYRLKFYYYNERVEFHKETYTTEVEAFLKARKEMQMFPYLLSKVDVYQDDKLIATVYG